MRPRVYVETSVVSYLTARPSRDLVTAAHQQLTREWWDRRGAFDLFVSQAVLNEAAGGDAVAAQHRLAAVAGLDVVPVTAVAEALAQRLIEEHAMSPAATIDALHVAIAVVNGMDYLVTWNCAHIANAHLRLRIERTCIEAGYEPPVICTPEELVAEEEP